MDINNVTLVGRLVRDVEIKNIGTTSLARFTIASEQGFRDKKSTGFFDCIAWGKQAETISKYMRKGKRVGIEGSLQFSTWENQGQKRSKIEIKVKNFQFLEKIDEQQSNIVDVISNNDNQLSSMGVIIDDDNFWSN